MNQIFGTRVLLDYLTQQQRQALVGKRVVACFERNTEGFDVHDVGTVTSAEPEDGIVLWVRGDTNLEVIGCFDDEHIIILELQEVV